MSITDAQQGSQTQPTCNSCCQGPAGGQGTPGIPGVPGTNGMPGSLGPKGDSGISVKGDPGLRGPKGNSGSGGLKGEQGMVGLQGPPGKIGPAGVAGSVGPSGLPGVKGQKGEVGQSRLSAFSAVRSNSFTPSSAGQALPFEQVHTNIGDDFDAATGQFTCEIPGIYIITYSVSTSVHNPVICLHTNNGRINCVYRTIENRHDVSSNTAVLQLTTGDTVWLWCRDSGKQVFSNEYRYTTFSGAILHEM